MATMTAKVVDSGAHQVRSDEGRVSVPQVAATVRDSPTSLQLLVDVLASPCQIVGAERGVALKLSAEVRKLLHGAVLTHLAGAVDDELSTQDAAKLLGVSRPTLIRMLDTRDIPYRTTQGNHRRVSRRALMDHLQKDLERRRKALDELGASADELGFFD